MEFQAKIVSLVGTGATSVTHTFELYKVLVSVGGKQFEIEAQSTKTLTKNGKDMVFTSPKSGEVWNCKRVVASDGTAHYYLNSNTVKTTKPANELEALIASGATFDAML
jgi:hypothetical protein